MGSKKQSNITWNKMPAGNLLLKAKGFIISFQPNVRKEVMGEEFNQIANLIGGLAGIDKFDESSKGETALYNGKVWRILNGDFRKDYEKVVAKGFKACLGVYDKHKKNNWCNWSTDGFGNKKLKAKSKN